MSNKAARQSRRQAQGMRSSSKRDAERRKDRLTTIGAIVAFLVIAGGAVAYVATKNGNGGASVSSLAQTVLPPPPRGRVPKQIRANIAEENRVIETSVKEKLAQLRGVPVVVNQWASWCPNCKAEFPFFQQASQQHVRHVAFLGLDSQDQRGGALSFLKTHPVNYPSVFDPTAQQAASLGGAQGWPTTIFFDRAGNRTFVHEGVYQSLAALEEDISRYALGS